MLDAHPRCMVRRCVVAFGLAVLTAACARTQRPAASVAAPLDGDRDSEGCYPDPRDVCDELPSCESEGCPEVAVGRCAAPGAALDVSRFATSLRADPRLTKVRLVTGDRDCGDRVSRALEAAGIPPERLEVDVNDSTSGEVMAHAAVYDGRACEAPRVGTVTP